MADSSAFPWLKHLPRDAAREFFEELSEAFGEAQMRTIPGVLVSAQTYVEVLDPLLASWKAKAEAHASAPRKLDENGDLPWLKHLGEDGQREFFEEILQISVISHELCTPISDYVERINVCVAAWKSTAEVHANPELLAALTKDHDVEKDFVEAERPTACCLEMDRCDHVDEEPELVRRARQLKAERSELPQRKSSAPRKLCPMSTPNLNEADSAHWCNLSAGHTGDHRSRDGHTWTDEDGRQARSTWRGATADLEIHDEIVDIPEPRRGE